MRMKLHKLVGILILVACLPVILFAGGKEKGRHTPAPAFMDVRLDAPVKFSHLKPGETLEGKVTRNVFSGYRLLVPRGSRVRLKVSGLRRGPKKHNYLWPWPIRYFVPKYEKLPSFKFANVALPDRSEVRLPVSAVPSIDEIHVAAHVKRKIKSNTQNKHSSGESKRARAVKRPLGPRIELVVDADGAEMVGLPSTASAVSISKGASLSEIKTLSPGSRVKLALVNTLSASRSRAGESFKALLEEPIRLNSGKVVPEGTVFEGRVTKSVPPRWLSRPASLYVIFTRLILPSKSDFPISASVAGVDVSQQSRIKMSSEGGMSGGSPGKARLLLDLGVGAAVSKEADDGYQLITEVLVSTATDASTAGTARLIGFACSGFYLMMQHGRDVVLPPYTTITIQFTRPPSLPSEESKLERGSAE